MSRNSNQLSVAELLARNGQQPSSGSGGRRRRGGGGVPISELSGELPAVDGASAHAAPDEEEPDGAAAHYAPDDYAGEQFPGDPHHSPMSGPITVYNPLDPQQSEPTEPDPVGGPHRGFPPDAAGAGRSGRRRRADPDDDAPVDGFVGADPVQQPWETGPPAPGGGRAARRRAAEALEAASAAPSAAEESEVATEYDPPPDGRLGPPPPPPSPGPPGFGPGPQGSGRPDAGPPWPNQGANGGPPRLGPPAPVAGSPQAPNPAPGRPGAGFGAPPPGSAADTWNAPAPATEAWQGPPPAGDARPKLERRRRGARPLPDPAPWPPPPAASPDAPEDTGAATNTEQATTIWPLAARGKNLRPTPPGLGAPAPVEPDRSGGHRNGPPPPGFADFDRQPPEYRDPGEFGAADSYATDIYEPLPPRPGPMPRESQPETGDFEPDFGPDSDIYPELEAPASESRADRARAALTTKFGAVSGKLAGVRARPDRTRESDRDDDQAADPRRQWLILGGQSVGAAVAGMLMFKGFEKLWEMQPLAALALAVVVILGLVALVRILRRTDDIYSIVIAVVVGVFVTLGPLAFLLSAG